MISKDEELVEQRARTGTKPSQMRLSLELGSKKHNNAGKKNWARIYVTKQSFAVDQRHCYRALLAPDNHHVAISLKLKAILILLYILGDRRKKTL